MLRRQPLLVPEPAGTSKPLQCMYDPPPCADESCLQAAPLACKWVKRQGVGLHCLGVQSIAFFPTNYTQSRAQTVTAASACSVSLAQFCREQMQLLQLVNSVCNPAIAYNSQMHSQIRCVWMRSYTHMHATLGAVAFEFINVIRRVDTPMDYQTLHTLFHTSTEHPN